MSGEGVLAWCVFLSFAALFGLAIWRDHVTADERERERYEVNQQLLKNCWDAGGKAETEPGTGRILSCILPAPEAG